MWQHKILSEANRKTIRAYNKKKSKMFVAAVYISWHLHIKIPNNDITTTTTTTHQHSALLVSSSEMTNRTKENKENSPTHREKATNRTYARTNTHTYTLVRVFSCYTFCDEIGDAKITEIEMLCSFSSFFSFASEMSNVTPCRCALPLNTYNYKYTRVFVCDVS